MAQIRDITPVTRSSVRTRLTDGTAVFRCVNPGNWHFYDSPAGLRPVEPHVLETATSRVGAIRLRGRHPVTVGLRTDGARAKFIGFRRDFDPAGTRQVELSLQALEINGKLVRDELWHRASPDPWTTALGPLTVRSHRQGTHVAIPLRRGDRFRAELRVHATGLGPARRVRDGEYHFRDECDRFFLGLSTPRLLDAAGNPLIDGRGEPAANRIRHSLEELGNGKYLYVKESAGALDGPDLPDKFLADADTIYSDTADCRIYNTAGSDWQTTHDATAGNNHTSTLLNSTWITWVPSNGNYLPRNIYFFDLSGVSGSVTAVTGGIYGLARYSGSTLGTFCFLKSTATTPTSTDDYDAFTGSAYGAETAWNESGWNTIGFNATGIGDTQSALSGTFAVMGMDYDHDYQDEAPVGHTDCVGGYYANQTGTDKDPYLEITTGASGGLAMPVALHHLRQQGIA